MEFSEELVDSLYKDKLMLAPLVGGYATHSPPFPLLPVPPTVSMVFLCCPIRISPFQV